MRSMMKISLLLLLLHLTSATSAVDYPTFPLPSTCPTSCGDLRIEYPFGIGRGCFRKGFELVCNESTSPPKLLLGHSDMELNRSITAEYGTVFIKRAVATMSVDVESSYIPLIDLPADSPYNFLLLDEVDAFDSGFEYPQLLVTGCSAVATLIDATRNTSLGECTTLCPINGTRPQKNFWMSNVVGFCMMEFFPFLGDGNNLIKSLGIQLTRLDQRELHLTNNSTINVFISDNDYDWKQLNGTEGEVEIALGWLIVWLINDEPTCEEARKKRDTYACLSSNSDCSVPWTPNTSQAGIGYFCHCSVGFYGNPYVPNGCQDTSLTHPPNRNCTRKCGTIKVPYPFGLEVGCYRDEPFALICNRKTARHPTLHLNVSYDLVQVSNILLQEGQLELKIHDDRNLRFFSGWSTPPFMLLNESVLFSWVIHYQSCDEAKKNMTTYACRDHSVCQNATMTNYGKEHIGYRCKCDNGFEGNPYVADGCQSLEREANGCLKGKSIKY